MPVLQRQGGGRVPGRIRHDISWDNRWRNYGISWAFVFFNAFVAVLSYYLFHVMRKR
ncbi:hypothetical protein GGR56DRAFT_651110 [Xylariaceae sp. FL0804]|nr:hypothetical protein GGR56DRAFT_651110 [Xylariaceae sp. FL0804]